MIVSLCPVIFPRALRPRLARECDLNKGVELICKNFAVSVYEGNGTFSLLFIFISLGTVPALFMPAGGLEESISK